MRYKKLHCHAFIYNIGSLSEACVVFLCFANPGREFWELTSPCLPGIIFKPKQHYYRSIQMLFKISLNL